MALGRKDARTNSRGVSGGTSLAVVACAWIAMVAIPSRAGAAEIVGTSTSTSTGALGSSGSLEAPHPLGSPRTPSGAEGASPHPPSLRLDPLADTAITAASGGIGLILELIVGTGELRPQPPVDPSVLLSIDRPSALSNKTEESGPLLSDVALGVSAAYVVLDSVRRGFEADTAAAATYGVLYAEALAINWALVGVVKIAVSRPRPVAYREYRRTGMVSSDTNAALSFYSGHTAAVAGVAATATYLAFDRDPHGIEGWLTLGIGTLATGFVAIQRVRAGAHFATDVIAGAVAGAAVGTLVPHLHRVEAPGGFGVGIVPYSDAEGRYGLVLESAF